MALMLHFAQLFLVTFFVARQHIVSTESLIAYTVCLSDRTVSLYNCVPGGVRECKNNILPDTSETLVEVLTAVII